MKKSFFISVISIMLVACAGEKTGVIKAPGIVDGDVITIRSLVSGQINRLSAREGDPVMKETLLAGIDSAKTENKLEELAITMRGIDITESKLTTRLQYVRSSAEFLDRQVQRFTRLKEKKSIPGEKLESMTLKLQEALTSEIEIKKSLESLAVEKSKLKKQQEYLDLVLGDHRITSPVDGNVIERFISPGDTVFPGTALFDILDNTSLFVEIFLEEREITGLTLNQKAMIQVDGIGGRTFEGRIGYFGRKAEFSPKYILSEKERESLLYRVKIILNQDLQVFKLGMPVTVILEKKR